MTSAARSVIAIWPTRGRVIHTAHWAASENPHPVGLNVSRRTRRRSPHPFGKRSSDNADADAPDGKADRPNVWVGPLPHDVRLIDLACSGRSVVLLLWRKGRHEGFNLPCPMLT